MSAFLVYISPGQIAIVAVSIMDHVKTVDRVRKRDKFRAELFQGGTPYARVSNLFVSFLHFVFDNAILINKFLKVKLNI